MTLLDQPPVVDPPELDSVPQVPQQRRKLGGVRRASLFNLVGAAVAGVSISFLIQQVTALSGALGLVLVAYVAFVVIYGVLVSLNDDAQVVRDAVMSVLLASTAVLCFSVLALVIGYTIGHGVGRAPPPQLLYARPLAAGPLAPLTSGGMAHALVGTVWQVGIAVILTVPIGLVAAVYLDMTRSRPAKLFRTVVEAMTALPSILAGLFIYASWIIAFGFQRSGLAAALALSVMMLPYIIRAADLALRLVPGNLREASAALGAPGWRGEWQVVLPTARSGLATAVILGVARAIGEASPVLLTAGFTSYMNANPLHGPWCRCPSRRWSWCAPASRLHHPGLRLRLLPPGGDHRPVPDRPPDRGLRARATCRRGASGGSSRPRPGTRPGSPRPSRVARPRRPRPPRAAPRPPPTSREADHEPVHRGAAAATRRLRLALITAVIGGLAALLLAAAPAGATSYVPISGEGSSWSANALDQWIANVQQDGMRVNFTANGSTSGREDCISGLTDFAASDIPFQTNPNDGSAPENPVAGSYAYMPITAGGTVFMYNLKINGQQVTNLRLSGENIAKIFTGVITNWDDPALADDNPGLKLPDETIVPVVRSDGAGTSY